MLFLNRRGLQHLLLAVVLLALLPTTATRAGTPSAPTGAPEVASQFRDYYNRHQGIRVLGNPLTDVVQVEGLAAQYFEKGRIEDHRAREANPAWAFAFGRLAVELMDRNPGAAVNNTSINYAELKRLADPSRRKAPPAGFNGGTANVEGGVFVPYDSQLRPMPGYVVPGYFWNYVSRNDLFPGGWLHDIGLPLTEAINIKANKNGEQRDIVLQAFERTVLTYDAKNPREWQVERGNVGADVVGTGSSVSGTAFYVSKRGNNGDGRSWASAWNELDRINWGAVQPGDTILIDGGSSEMRYESTLKIGKNGAPGAPITIRLASEGGRNGKAIIFGGRSTPLPYCEQRGYGYQTDGVRDVGIDVKSSGWIVIDGGKWRGIVIHGHNKRGMDLERGANNVIVRNVEIYDNGNAYERNGVWQPNQEGVNLSGTNITFERALIHDNGQDAFQGAGIRNFTLRSSWLYNERPDPTGTRPFNYCRHSDGIQIFDGGNQSGVLIEDSVIGPGFLQGVLLGEGPVGEDPWAVVNDVTIRHTLFFKSMNANIASHDTQPRNWTIENVTSYREDGMKNHNIIFEGAGHTIRNSIFSGGRAITLPKDGVAVQGNCQWQVPNGREIGETVDPGFVDVRGNNYALRNGSPCSGKGSRITSVAQLLGR